MHMLHVHKFGFAPSEDFITQTVDPRSVKGPVLPQLIRGYIKAILRFFCAEHGSTVCTVNSSDGHHFNFACNIIHVRTRYEI